MDALFHELPAADDRRVRAPFLLDAGAAANAVAPATEHHLADVPFQEPAMGVENSRVVPMVESAFENALGLAGDLAHSPTLFNCSP